MTVRRWESDLFSYMLKVEDAARCGARLKAACDVRGWDAAEVAQRMCCTTATVRRLWRKGMGRGRAEHIARVLDVPEILEGET